MIESPRMSDKICQGSCILILPCIFRLPATSATGSRLCLAILRLRKGSVAQLLFLKTCVLVALGFTLRTSLLPYREICEMELRDLVHHSGDGDMDGCLAEMRGSESLDCRLTASPV